jgi:chromosomal replication initiation ATPase DnaA
MPIGNGPDREQFDREAEREQKLFDTVQAWWDSKEHEDKFELVSPYYPDEAHLLDVDEMFSRLDWGEKVSLWEEELEGFHGVRA